MRIHKRLIALFWTLMAPAIGFAAEIDSSSKVWDTLAPAWDRVSNRLIDFAGENKQKLLSDLAFAAVSSSQCGGLELDKDKFKSAFDSLNDADYKALSPEAQSEYGPKIMSYYGIYVGLLLSEGLLEKEAFCGYAMAQQAKGEGAYWIATPSK